MIDLGGKPLHRMRDLISHMWSIGFYSPLKRWFHMQLDSKQFANPQCHYTFGTQLGSCGYSLPKMIGFALVISETETMMNSGLKMDL